MKTNKIMFLTIVALLLITSYLLLTPDTAESAPFGVVLIAHGSDKTEWNARIQGFYNSIKNELPPSQLAFLQFVAGSTLEDAVNALKAGNPDVQEFLFVHLSPSSYSIRHEEIELKVSQLPTPPLKYQISPAMDDHPLAIAILKDYANEFYINDPARSPANESLILIGYGAPDELENVEWVRKLKRIGESIRIDLGFREVACMTLRHHAADLVRSQAIADLQETAKRLKEQGRVVVVPYILSALPQNHGFIKELESCLRGIVKPGDICKKGVISHDNTKAWVKEVVRNQMNQTGIRPVNRNWSAMDAEKGGDSKYKYGNVTIEKTPR
jgi:hypothetical protein